MPITKEHNGFWLEIEASPTARQIFIFTEKQDWGISVKQSAGEDGRFSKPPLIAWDEDWYSTIEDARRFAQAIELAAVIAADITSWLE
jgi:hypothetical protein